jgi:hypothetical protein
LGCVMIVVVSRMPQGRAMLRCEVVR